MQYHSVSGTNRLVFRGRIPADGVAGGFITDVVTFSMATDGSSAVDGNGTTVTACDATGGSTPKWTKCTTAIFSTTAKKTGSNVNTLTAQAGSSSTANILTELC